MSWEVLYGVGAALLAIALIWGVYRSATRNRRNDAVTEKAVHEEYAHPDRYKQTQDEFRKEVRPS